MDEQNNPGGNAPSDPSMAGGMPSTPPAAEPAVAEPAPMPATTPAPEPTAAPAAEPAGVMPSAPESQSQPQADQKCVTCGNTASGGQCTACGQGEMTCTCQPGSQGGSAPTV